MFARSRLDALCDGIFAVAMTLLVLDLRLPEDFHPQRAGDLIDGLSALWPKFLPYAISFGVLGMRWLSNVELRTRAEFFDRHYASWWMVYLLLITCVPFTTIVLSRFGNLAPALWLYVGHTLLIALVGVRLVALTPGLETGPHIKERQTGSIVLIASSILAFAVSFVSPREALWALALNFIAPGVTRLFRRRASA
jgi:uncharacterized membrane protein